MEENKNRKYLNIIAVVFCALGLSMLVASRFIETEINLQMIGLVLNGIGLIAFVTKRN
ncbi:MAG: hypothetical protein P1U56_15950 [Saprospiraceae bacterium]|nr:hypothetical protein [Saprospiraceae bacterium]